MPQLNAIFSYVFPMETRWEICDSQAGSDGYGNLLAQTVSMNLSACCFHLGVTSIICQSCPQIVTKEKEDGS